MAISGVYTKFGSEAQASAVTWSITGPSAAAEGDLIWLAAVIGTIGTVVTPAPAPFVERINQIEGSTDGRLVVWTKPAGVSEAGPYSVTWSAAQAGLAGWGVYSGVDATTPMDAAPVSADRVAATAQSTPSITPVTNGAMLVGLFGCDPAATGLTATWTSPATERLDNFNGAGAHLTIGDRLQSAAANESLSGTLSASEAVAAAIMALRPAAPAAPPPAPSLVAVGVYP